MTLIMLEAVVQLLGHGRKSSWKSSWTHVRSHLGAAIGTRLFTEEYIYLRRLSHGQMTYSLYLILLSLILIVLIVHFFMVWYPNKIM